MKVFLFSTQWPEYMIELANAMAGHAEVHLMLATNHRFVDAHRGLIGSRVIFYPFHVTFHKSIRDNFRMLRTIVSAIRRVDPDVVHIQANGHRLFHLILPLLPRRAALVNTIHDPVKHTGDAPSNAIDDRAAIYWCKKYTDAYIVHGETLRQTLADSYGADIGVIHAIPHGHFGIYRKLQTEQASSVPRSALFFGRIWPYKGLKYFIEAANLLTEKYPDARFYIVGAGESIDDDLKKVSSRKNFEIVNERVAVERAGVYFQKSTVVVLPYTDATQSGVIPVAYAYGRPVVASDVGAIAEVVEEGRTGFLVPPRDPEALASKIERFFADPQLADEMRSSIQRMLESKLSWADIAIKTLDVYSRALSANR